jgi:hypothetical protein
VRNILFFSYSIDFYSTYLEAQAKRKELDDELRKVEHEASVSCILNAI